MYLRWKRLLRKILFVILQFLICLWIVDLLTVERKPINIIIVSKARSGSSLLSKLLGVGSILTVFEPIRRYFGETFKPNFTTDVESKVKNLLIDFLDECDMDNKTILFDQLKVSSAYWSGIELCVTDFCPEFGYKQVHEILCRETAFQVMKTIFLPIKNLYSMFTSFKNPLLVVHLVRDPRGMIKSQREVERTFHPKIQPLTSFSKNLCKEMLEDLAYANIFRSKYQSSYIFLRYEDLVQNPVHEIKRILSAAGIKFTMLHYYVIYTRMMSSRNEEDYLFTTYRVSRTRPTKWSRDLSWNEVQEIQKHCRRVLDKLNYSLVLSPQQLKAVNESFYDKTVHH